MRGASSIIIAAIGGVWTGTAHAAACIDGHPSVEQAYRAARFVVDAKVVSISKERPRRSLYKGRIVEDPVRVVTLRVIKSYKGPATKLITFENTNDSARVLVEVGERHLLFMGQWPGESWRYVDTCGPSDRMDRISKTSLATLSRLAAQTGVAKPR